MSPFSIENIKIPSEFKSFIHPQNSNLHRNKERLKASIEQNPTIVKTYEIWALAYRHTVDTFLIFQEVDKVLSEIKAELSYKIEILADKIDKIAIAEKFQFSSDEDIIDAEERIELANLGILEINFLHKDARVQRILTDKTKRIQLIPFFKKFDIWLIISLLTGLKKNDLEHNRNVFFQDNYELLNRGIDEGIFNEENTFDLFGFPADLNGFSSDIFRINQKNNDELFVFLKTKIQGKYLEHAIDFFDSFFIEDLLKLLLKASSEEEKKIILDSLSSNAIYKYFYKFDKDILLLHSLIEKEGGQQIIVELLKPSSGIFYTYNESTREHYEKLFSLIDRLDASHLMSLLTDMPHDFCFLKHISPIMLEKLTSEQITQLLLQPKGYGNLSIHDPEVLSLFLTTAHTTTPLLKSNKMQPEHLYKLLFYKKEKIRYNIYPPIRDAIFKGMIDAEFLYKICGLDFNGEVYSSPKSSAITIPQIQNDIFKWADSKPKEERVKAMQFALSMGCIKEFFESPRSEELFKDLSSSILSTISIEEKLLYDHFHYIIPFLRFLLSQDGGHEIIIKIFVFNSAKFLKTDSKIHTINFLNSLLRDQFNLVKDIIAKMMISALDLSNLLENIDFSLEQLVEVLGLQTPLMARIFDYLIRNDQQVFILENLTVKQLIHFLSIKNSMGKTLLHTSFPMAQNLLKKILSDKNEGFSTIHDLLSITDNEHNRPIVAFNECFKFFQYVGELENGPQFLRTLLVQENPKEKRFIKNICYYYEHSMPARSVFEFINKIPFTPNELFEFLFPDENAIPILTTSNIIWAAVPLFTKLARHEETKEKLIRRFIPENPTRFSNFDKAADTWEVLSFLIELYPNRSFISHRLCAKNNLKNILTDLYQNDELKEILPVLQEYLSSALTVQALSHFQKQKMKVTTSLFEEVALTLSEYLESHHLIQFLWEENQELFKKMLLECVDCKNLLIKAFSIDFDPSLIPWISPSEDSFEQIRETRLLEAVTNWIHNKPQGTERAKSILLLYLLEYNDLFYEECIKLSEEEQGVLHSIMPSGALIKIAAQAYEINPSHMHEKVQINVRPPLPIPMENIEFVGVPKRNSGHGEQKFCSFIQDMIAGAVNDAVNSGRPLSGTTVAALQNMERKIRENEFVYGMNEPREEEFKLFCSYLTHVVMGYKIGQFGGDSADKEMILNGLADQSLHCFPGWKQFIQQCYGMISKDQHITAVTLKDRVLARLQAERKYILSVRMLMLGQVDNIHEPNYLLDMFREDLGTQLEPINDPHTQTDGFQRNYGKDKGRLRKEFDEIYTKEYLVSSIAHHINEQQERTRQSKFILDLPPLWVSDWLREHCGSSWKQEEYEKIRQQVSAMQLEGKKIEEIDAFLLRYGIERRQEDSVEEAIKELKRDIAIARKRDFIKINTSLKEKIEDIYSIADLGQRSLKKKEFLELNPSIEGSVNSSKEQLKKSVDAFIFSQKERIKKLEDLLENVENAKSENIQKDILRKNGRIQSAQSFDEVIAPYEIKNAQIAKFFSDVVYRNLDIKGKKKRLFTLEAATLLLESMGVLQKNKL